MEKSLTHKMWRVVFPNIERKLIKKKIVLSIEKLVQGKEHHDKD